MKSIYETLAALGTGAILLSGCGASNKPAADVPAAVEITPQSPTAAEPTQGMSGDAAASDASKDGNAAASPGEKSAEPAMSAAPTTSAAPATGAAPAAKTKAAPKATAGTKPKKKDAAGSCGEGTCS